MSEENSNKGQNYKLLETPKTVLLLMKDSICEDTQRYISEQLGPRASLQVHYPNETESLKDLLDEGCDVAVVDPLVYTGVNHMRDFVSKVKAHTRQGLILVKRNWNYSSGGLEKEVDYQADLSNPVTPHDIAQKVGELLHIRMPSYAHGRNY
jgi:hypothetical protein